MSGQVSDEVCQTAVFLILLPIVSIHTVALLAIDRLIYLKKPMKYQVIVTPRRMLGVIIVVWVLCTGLSIPSLALKTLFHHAVEMQGCVPSFDSLAYVIPVLAESVLVIILQCVVCVWMLCIARNHLKKKFHNSMAEAETLRRVYAANKETTIQNGSKDVQREYNKSQLHLVK